jgi:hypothetical protein
MTDDDEVRLLPLQESGESGNPLRTDLSRHPRINDGSTDEPGKDVRITLTCTRAGPVGKAVAKGKDSGRGRKRRQSRWAGTAKDRTCKDKQKNEAYPAILSHERQPG